MRGHFWRDNVINTVTVFLLQMPTRLSAREQFFTAMRSRTFVLTRSPPLLMGKAEVKKKKK
jgi:hypothetical protein